MERSTAPGSSCRRNETMEEIVEMLGWIRPALQLLPLRRDTLLVEELALDSLEGLQLCAMVEARYGRCLNWDRPLATLGDLLDYLMEEGIAIEEVGM